MGSKRYEDLEEILRDDWKGEIGSGSFALLQLVDCAKLSETSTKRIKELLKNYSDGELAELLNMKTKERNQRAYKDYKLRQAEEHSILKKEISCLHSQKKSLIEQRSNLINEILLYNECIRSAAHKQ